MDLAGDLAEDLSGDFSGRAWYLVYICIYLSNSYSFIISQMKWMIICIRCWTRSISCLKTVDECCEDGEKWMIYLPLFLTVVYFRFKTLAYVLLTKMGHIVIWQDILQYCCWRDVQWSHGYWRILKYPEEVRFVTKNLRMPFERIMLFMAYSRHIPNNIFPATLNSNVIVSPLIAVRHVRSYYIA